VRFIRWGRRHEPLPVEVDQAEPDEAEPAAHEPLPVEVDQAEPDEVEPAAHEPDEPDQAEPAAHEPDEPDQAEPDEAAAHEPLPVEPAAGDQVDSDEAQAAAHEPLPVEADRAEPVESEPAAGEPVEPDEPDQVEPDEAQAEAHEPVEPDEAEPADFEPVESVVAESTDVVPLEPVVPIESVVPLEPVEPQPWSFPDEADAVAAEAAEADPDVGVDDAPRFAHAEAADADPDVDAEVAPLLSSAVPVRAPFVLWSGPAGESADDPTGEGRSPALRFASLHLRGGQHALARAELEALAGRGRLDEPALLDLAEIRWRTGDLAGAGDAANALLARGSESPLALVIAAEAVAAVGRPGEARRLSSRALEAADGPLDALFAGMPRSTIWPATPDAEALADAPRRRGRNRAGDTSGAPSTASEAFAGGRAALARGDATRAALLLGVAMRLAPEFAEDVLRAVTGRDDQPLLALVRGDALRLLGREAEALEAFDRARGRASAAASGSASASTGPGLFDDDPAITVDEDAGA
jgi:tetratricopeptide (TPR) repeat protein